MKLLLLKRIFTSTVLALAICSSHPAERFEWADGHGDLGVSYADGNWFWHAHQGKPVDQVSIRLEDITRHEIPDDPAFEFLGSSGNPIWIIAAGQTPGIPFLGVSSEATTRAGTFADDRFDLYLSSVSAPGDFIMWTIGGTGMPTILMNSRDGIADDDRTDVPAPGHFHQNWGFTAPGTYQIGFKAEGRLTDGTTPITSQEVIYTYEVNALKKGEADIEVAFENGALEFHIHEEITDVEHAPGHVALQAGPATWQTVPQSADFNFLGQSGSPLFVLPQEETEGILALGLVAEIDSGVFANDILGIHLVKVEGPGSAFYYEVDGFGKPTVWLNSADGIDPTDSIPATVGSHVHRNWAFTAPGFYQITLQAEGTLATGGKISSETEVFIFEVLPPTIIGQGEVDLEIAFLEGAFDLGLHEDVTERDHFPDETILVAGHASQSAVPEGSDFSFLGTVGAPLFILPQDETEGLVFLGLAADEIEAGTFAGETVNLELASLDGPGALALYGSDSFGNPIVFWNSADGLDAVDAFPAAIGSHSHLNWAFTEPGIYRIGLKASGILATGNTTISSDIETFTINVQAQATPLLVHREGEIDFEAGYQGGILELGFHNDATNEELEPAEILLIAQPTARQFLPEGPAFAFLGSAGDLVYILPQEEREGLLFIGIAGAEIQAGLFSDESVNLELISVNGPGQFALYALDGFGNPNVFMNSLDGVTSADIFPIAAGSHTHLNWGFTSQGAYQLAFKATGTLSEGGQTVASETVTVAIDIEAGGPKLTATQLTDRAQILIEWQSKPDRHYQLQSRTSLDSGTWIDAGNLVIGSGGVESVTFDSANDPFQVFRIVSTEP